jgi:hypothetical protein
MLLPPPLLLLQGKKAAANAGIPIHRGGAQAQLENLPASSDVSSGICPP